MTNPIINIILDTLKKYPEGFDEYTLIKRIEAEGLFPELSQHADLQLFQKHFITMNSLYSLQQALWDDAQLHLSISALEIKIKPRTLSAEQSLAQPLEDAQVKAYYLDWCHFDSANPDYVVNLLNSFWERFVDTNTIKNALTCLDLPLDTSDKHVIKQQFRMLAAKHHPDKGGDQSTFISIREAYELLMR